MSQLTRWENDGSWVEIDLDMCVGRGACAETCPADVYVVDGKVDAEHVGDCIGCGACQDVCPGGAIVRHGAWE